MNLQSDLFTLFLPFLGGQTLNLSTSPSFKIHSTWTTESFHPTATSLLSRSSPHLTSARPKLGGKGLADEGNTRVAGAGGGRTVRLGGCRAGPTGNRERGGGAGGGAGGREPKFTTGSCDSTTGRSICNKNPREPIRAARHVRKFKLSQGKE